MANATNAWFHIRWACGSTDAEFSINYWLPAGLEQPNNGRARGEYVRQCIAFGKKNGCQYIGFHYGII